MRVLFFWFNLNCPARMNIGVSVLAAELKKAGHEAGVVYLNEKVGRRFDPGGIISECKEFGPDLFALSFGSNHFKYAAELIRELKGLFPATKVICGGLHATLKPEEVISVPGVDYLCIGEGDGVFAEFVSRLEKGGDIGGMKSFWIRTESGVIRNTMEAPPAITAQTMLDVDVVDHRAIIMENRGIFETIAGRGCPNRCTFCYNHALRCAYARHTGASEKDVNYFRLRSVGNLIDELKMVLSKYGDIIKLISFADDAFNYDKRWLSEFVEAYRKNINLPYTANILLDKVDEKIADGLFRSGCSLARVGLESGSEEIRSKVLKKPFSAADVYRAFRILAGHHVNTRVYLMIGLPGERCEDMLSTFELVARLKADSARLCVFYPLPGTEIYDYCARNNLIGRSGWDNFDTISILKWPEETGIFLKKAVAIFDWIQNMYLRSGISPTYEKLVGEAMRMSAGEWESDETRKWIAETSRECFERFRSDGHEVYFRPFPESPYTAFLYNRKRKIPIVNID
ncbi:MAG: radical SAM protein [bacterium]